MEVVETNGLSIAMIGTGELAGEPWADHPAPIDLVRTMDPPAGAWDELAARGFIRKPDWLSWTADLGAGEAEYLARMEAKPRQVVRRAVARAERELTLTVPDRIDPATLDRFLALYRDRVERMTYGVTVACRYREAILDGPDRYFGVFAYDGPELAGGCLVLERPEQDAVRIRFSAVTERWRRASLARALYLVAMRAGRARGYRRVGLGDEPNLYGHVAKAGLFPFKVSMGFRCVPSQDNHDPHGRDCADLVLTVRNLCGPGLLLGYAGRDRTLTAHVVADDPVDLRRFSAPFLAGADWRKPAGGGPCTC
ncbi:GNAT family N-acetyltransferase [Actinophytocola sp.]|uniref:GNAT family N-acetyltransferase n=1 Tax=Actinophytocola sp. TaxID=1872138 RepID=UPI002D7FD0B3|nr:GNAT family N-acetyltransferase [Actinophytocola sp.]HET9141296.1 GNAT family N-acetyltransferase [Actinophytocola sp.]